MSAKIVVTEFLSLDGVMEAPNEWNLPYVDETMGAEIQADLDRATALLYGRATFAVMASAWPTRTGPTAERFNGLPKFVVSRTLTQPEWKPTTVLRGDPVLEVRALKRWVDGTILVWGSRRLAQAIAAARLVDEYRLFVHPLVLGKGTRLFADGDAGEMELMASRAFARGVVGLTYRARAVDPG